LAARRTRRTDRRPRGRVVRGRGLPVDARPRPRCMACHRQGRRHGRVRTHRPRLDLLPQRPAQGPQLRPRVGLVHRHLRHRLHRVHADRAVPAADARAPAPHHVALGGPGPGGAGAARPAVHPLIHERPRMRIPLTIVLGGLLATPVYAAELTVEVEIPSMTVAEYHRPYVAVYVEGADGKAAADLSVWYMMKDTAEGHGTKWLPDLRQWWRKSGRTQQMP